MAYSINGHMIMYEPRKSRTPVVHNREYVREPQRKIREIRLQKYVRVLSGKYNISVNLVKIGIQHGFAGCSDAKNRIMISTSIDKDEYINLIMQKSVSLHELGHIVYTDLTPWKNAGVSHELCNIIEDGRVEEAVSRKYPKARSYFFYMNKKLLSPKAMLFRQSLQIKTLDFILRTAKSTTGAPPVPEKIKKQLQKRLEDDYYWLGSRTRKAVTASTEEEAAQITKAIQEKLCDIFKENLTMPNMTKTPYSSIEEQSKKGKPSRDMPVQRSNDTLSKEIESILEKEFIRSSSEQSSQMSKEEKEIQENQLQKTYKKISEEIKKDILKEAEKECASEIKEKHNGKVEQKFGSYSIKKEHTTLDGNPLLLSSLEPLARQIVHMFKIISQSKCSWERNQSKGKLEMHNLPQLFTSTNNPKIFKQKIKEEKTDISVVILLDSSSSMEKSCKVATETTYVIARALELGNYNVEVLAFGVNCSAHPHDLYGIKSFNQKLIYVQNKFVPRAIDGTPLGNALHGAKQSLQQVKSARKIIIVVTDGYPDDIEKSREIIFILEKQGIPVIGILIQVKDRYEIFLKHRRISCYYVSDLVYKMTSVIKNVLVSVRDEI